MNHEQEKLYLKMMIWSGWTLIKKKRATPSILRMTMHLAPFKHVRHSNSIPINKLEILPHYLSHLMMLMEVGMVMTYVLEYIVRIIHSHHDSQVCVTLEFNKGVILRNQHMFITIHNITNKFCKASCRTCNSRNTIKQRW